MATPLSTGNNSFTIRPATAADVPLIRSLADDVWPATYASILSQEQIDYMMRMMYSADALREQMQQGHQFVVVYDGEQPVGFASFNQLTDGVYKLQKIYVLPNQQGRGTGKRLLDYVMKEVSAKGARELRLNVNRHNKAKGFYERLGFEVLKEEKIDIGNGYVMDDYVLTKKTTDGQD